MDEFGLLGDGVAHPCDARCVGEGQVVLVADRNGGADGHLAAAMQREGRIEGLAGSGVGHAAPVRTAVGAVVDFTVATRIDDLSCHVF